jgi:hypothetical protein
MLHTKIDSERYKSEFIKKLSNFCEKSPVLLSFVTADDGVTIIHANTGKRYAFEWDFTKPVKAFIHDIKKVLVENHYPRMIENIITDVPLTPEEQAQLLEEGVEPSSLPTTRQEITQRIWRIDRVIVWRDIFILVDEATQKQSRWKMNKSCVYYLKNYRSGKFTLESSWDYFVKNSTFLNDIEPKANESESE